MEAALSAAAAEPLAAAPSPLLVTVKNRLLPLDQEEIVQPWRQFYQGVYADEPLEKSEAMLLDFLEVASGRRVDVIPYRNVGNFDRTKGHLTDMLGSLERNDSDLGLRMLYRRDEYLPHIDYLWGMGKVSLSAGYLRSDTDTHQEDIFLARPYTIAAVGATVLVVALVMLHCLRLERGPAEEKDDVFSDFRDRSFGRFGKRLSEIWLWAASILGLQGTFEISPDRIPVRLVHFVGVTSAMLGYVIYSGTMASDIANRKEAAVDMEYLNLMGFEPIMTSRQVLRLQDPQNQHLTFIESNLLLSPDFMEIFGRRGDRSKSDYTFSSVHDFFPELLYGRSRKKRFMVFTDSFLRRKTRQLTAFQQGRLATFLVEIDHPFALAPRIDIPFPSRRREARKVILAALLKSKEAGLLKRVEDIWIPPSGSALAQDLNEHHTKPASLLQVMSAFWVLGIGYALALSIFVLELAFPPKEQSLPLIAKETTIKSHKNQQQFLQQPDPDSFGGWYHTRRRLSRRISSVSEMPKAIRRQRSGISRMVRNKIPRVNAGRQKMVQKLLSVLEIDN